jgi:hypothetical protein
LLLQATAECCIIRGEVRGLTGTNGLLLAVLVTLGRGMDTYGSEQRIVALFALLSTLGESDQHHGMAVHHRGDGVPTSNSEKQSGIPMDGTVFTSDFAQNG